MIEQGKSKNRWSQWEDELILAGIPKEIIASVTTRTEGAVTRRIFNLEGSDCMSYSENNMLATKEFLNKEFTLYEVSAALAILYRIIYNGTMTKKTMVNVYNTFTKSSLDITEFNKTQLFTALIRDKHIARVDDNSREYKISDETLFIMNAPASFNDKCSKHEKDIKLKRDIKNGRVKVDDNGNVIKPARKPRRTKQQMEEARETDTQTVVTEKKETAVKKVVEQKIESKKEAVKAVSDVQPEAPKVFNTEEEFEAAVKEAANKLFYEQRNQKELGVYEVEMPFVKGDTVSCLHTLEINGITRCTIIRDAIVTSTSIKITKVKKVVVPIVSVTIDKSKYNDEQIPEAFPIDCVFESVEDLKLSLIDKL